MEDLNSQEKMCWTEVVQFEVLLKVLHYSVNCSLRTQDNGDIVHIDELVNAHVIVLIDIK